MADFIYRRNVDRRIIDPLVVSGGTGRAYRCIDQYGCSERIPGRHWYPFGNGCTSGHGVCGVGRLAPRSILASATFFFMAMISAYLIRHGIGYLKHLAIIMIGMLFALGLSISGMTLPQKVIGFLDVAGADWDPSLGMVMVASFGTYLLLHRYVLQLPQSLFDTEFHVPSPTGIDAPLLIGAGLFGIGWGIVGFCPGPALTALIYGQVQVWIFSLR